jgi:hypothetical protein
MKEINHAAIEKSASLVLPRSIWLHWYLEIRYCSHHHHYDRPFWFDPIDRHQTSYLLWLLLERVSIQADHCETGEGEFFVL